MFCRKEKGSKVSLRGPGESLREEIVPWRTLCSEDLGVFCKIQASTQVKMRVRVERKTGVLYVSSPFFFFKQSFPTLCSFCSGLSHSLSPNPDSNQSLDMTPQTSSWGKIDLKWKLLVALNFPEQTSMVSFQVQLWVQRAQKLEILKRPCLKADDSTLQNLSSARNFSDTLKWRYGLSLSFKYNLNPIHNLICSPCTQHPLSLLRWKISENKILSTFSLIS